jgi:uncharacterized protein YutE (UPF0331/DUF86 family)
MNDVIINKIQSIQRCIKRAREEYEADREGFAANYTRQDAALLNILRACETAIDLANYVIRTDKLGIPVSSAESFNLLQAAHIMDERLAELMIKMVGFRNTVVHQYTKVNIRIVESVIVSGLDDLLTFTDKIREHVQGPSS